METTAAMWPHMLVARLLPWKQNSQMPIPKDDTHKAYPWDRRVGPRLPPLVQGGHIRRNKIYEKAPLVGRAFWFSSLVVCLLGDYVGRTRAFSALSDLELDLLALVERCIARRLDLRVVDKQILPPVIRVDEAKPLT